jgi:hypothetical protein
MANADQSPSEAREPEPQVCGTAHAYDAPHIGPRAFLLAVMHDRHAPIRDRIKAASTLLRLFPYDWDAPRLKYIIGGIPSEALGPCQSRPAMEPTEKHSHFSAIAHKAPSHMTDDPRPLNIETIISDIKSGNFPTPTLCTICGHYMPYPCSTSKTLINGERT